MLVAVRMPPIEIRGETIPREFIEMVRDFFGDVEVLPDEADDDEILTPETSTWFQDLAAGIAPGETMRHYRRLHRMTQTDLGNALGGVARQEISKMETGTRPISKKTAKKLAGIFDVSVARFI